MYSFPRNLGRSLASGRLRDPKPHSLFYRSLKTGLRTEVVVGSKYSNIGQLLKKFTSDKRVIEFVGQHAELMNPEDIVVCDGSMTEKVALENELVHKGTLIRLNEKLRPSSFLARSNPGDVARVEEKTFICAKMQEDAGPTNYWKDPTQTKLQLAQTFKDAMQGRTLYVIPFSMGPLGSSFSRFGVQLSDSPYVVLHMRIMTRMGSFVWGELEKSDFVRAVHTVGRPILNKERDDVPWPCNPEKTTICHFPETKEIYSFGSGYGGNALLGKKCFALRIASVLAREEGWLAEHMLISGVTSPEGKKSYIAGSFPSACGKTNLAMLRPTLPGWKVDCVGDDIAWMRFTDGQLRAINPEAGFFGVAPGTSHHSNPNAMATIERNTIFTNVALTPEGDVWWEGMTSNPPSKLFDWQGREWTPTTATGPASHPNARFSVSASQCPNIDPQWEDSNGVPISSILFGGRRASTVPLVYGARNWEHAVFLGATMSSETTAAAAGKTGQLRNDPFAMLPFCGYNMGDYFKHWLDIGQKARANNAQMPGFYHVNWFRKNPNGGWLWPGFGENVRVLKWILGKSNKQHKEEPIGRVPTPEDLDLSGLNIPAQNLNELLKIDRKEWVSEVQHIETYFSKFGSKLPLQLKNQLQTLKQNLEK